jgi:3-hydroxyisobutyrate dehydrogenase-like beta-hydroxyacid dehydrogenase
MGARAVELTFVKEKLLQLLVLWRLKMKAGFIGLGRMGQAMARRLLDGGHDLGVYNRTADKLKPLIGLGAKALDSIKRAATYGEAVFTMLADDAAVMEVASKPAGLVESLPKGGIHICAGTHSVACIAGLKERHDKAGQVLLATPMLGRPEVVLSGQAGMVLAGAKASVDRCRPLFDAIARRSFAGGTDPIAAAAIKIANNFVLGCAIEAMGEGFALVRKYDVAPEVFLDVMTDGLFACSAYKVYGKIITEQRYQPAGQRAVLGLKDANLALAAGEAVGVPLPSGNVWRDRLVGALAHGEGEHDWAVMAKDQARASGLD